MRSTITRFTVVIAVLVLATPLAVQAQQARRVPLVGVVFTSTPEQTAHLVKALVDGLRDLGRIEGENIAFEYRFAAWKPERLPDLVAELVRLKVDVMVIGLGPPTLAAKQATSTIPIVVPGALNPVETGLVASLARPGGNITGLSYEAGPEIAGKWLQLLKEAAPSARRVAILWNPGLGGMEPYFREARRAASALGLTLEEAQVRESGDFESAFAAIVKARADAVWVIPDPALVYPHRKRVLEFALKNRLPAFAAVEGLAEAGALFSYAVSLTDLYRRAGVFVDKILKGAKPGDLPVEQPTKFELVINLRTAKALGLTIPRSLLLRADRVIE